MRQQKEHKLRMAPGTYYVWCGRSCDYGHEERCSGGAYIMQRDEEVMYIQQNFDKEPTDKSANGDLINECISMKRKHNDVSVKIIPFHKYQLLPQTHELAHEAMMEHRSK